MKTLRSLLLALMLSACADVDDVMVPTIVGPWWRIAGEPDLGRYTSADQQVVDFAIWRAADGTWQAMSCVRHTAYPGATRVFHRWEGEHLADRDWAAKGIAMTSEPALGETEGGLQAPFVLRHDGRFLFFYGDYENIAMAVGPDGKRFTRVVQGDGRVAMFQEAPGANTRDPMVLTIGGVFHLYYTAHPLPEGDTTGDPSQGLGAVYLRTSRDLVQWSASTRAAAGGEAGWGTGTAESPFVHFHRASGYYYLFRTQAYGPDAETRVYRSRDPRYFGIDDDRLLVAALPVAAPEIVEHAGETYIAALMPDLKGIRLARLEWLARPR